MRRATQRASPHEACGLLLGQDRAVLDAVPIHNLESALGAFRMDPLAWIRAADAASDRGLEVVGEWHSHPRGDVEPSARDIESARSIWPSGTSWLHAIVGVGLEVAIWQLASHAIVRRNIRTLDL